VTHSLIIRRLWLALAALFLADASLQAADLNKRKAVAPATIALPQLGEVRTLAAQPTRIVLKGGDDAQQLIITATLGDGRPQDLTGDVRYRVADGQVARVTSSGRVIPLANGATEVSVTYGDKTVIVPIAAEAIGDNPPINFANQIVPILTKLGCNGGGCHGKASGQNGFHLSLLGFDPDFDYSALVKEARGRRVFAASPEHSLILLKASGTIAHGGGKRMELDSDEYKLIRRWIAAGTPFGDKNDPVVTKITVYPEHRILTRENKQQVAAYAHYSDGSVEDITRRAQYESNDTDIAVVEADGLVRTLGLSGEAAIMARYQGQVAVFRATVPLGVKTPEYRFPAQTLVDQYTHKKWQELGLVPSELCTDEQFIRRASLDITGTLPSLDQVRRFLADTDANKRVKLVDALLETPEYGYYFAGKWADVLQVKRGRRGLDRAYGTFAFHNWIRSAVAADKPYDEFVRAIIGAIGDETKFPPAVWYKDLQSPEQFVDNMAQVFLGVRMACAQCHHHPYEKWSQDDYWGLAAFFGRLGRKNLQVAGEGQQGQQQLQALYTLPNGSVANKRTGKPAVMRPLDGSPVDVEANDDPRQRLVDWMADAQNPFFARAVGNRYWAHFFGRGIVDPLDDLRVTNPPSNPELLDALARDLVEHKYSLKHLIRTICKSRTYQLDSYPNDFNRHDRQNYSRYYPKRMTAEVLYDAVSQVTKSLPAFDGLPQDAFAPRRAIMLPDESFTSYFLDVFGRPQRISACECERVSEANLAQSLHLLNSEEIQRKLSQRGGRAEMLAKDPRPDADKVAELFLWAFARKPTPGQLQLVLEHLALNPKDKQAAYENVIWALINTKEFIFNR
jgi:hypothetical protein